MKATSRRVPVTRAAFEASVAELKRRGYERVELTDDQYLERCHGEELGWSPAGVEQAFDARGVLAHALPLRWAGHRGDVQAAFARHGLSPVIARESEEDESHGTGVLDRASAYPTHLVTLVRALDTIDGKKIVTGCHVGHTQSAGWEHVAAIALDRGIHHEHLTGIYWHEQSHDAFDARGALERPLYLHWGGSRAQLAEALEKALAGSALRLEVPTSDREAFVVSASEHAITAPAPEPSGETFADAVARARKTRLQPRGVRPKAPAKKRHAVPCLPASYLAASASCCVGAFMAGCANGVMRVRPFVLRPDGRPPQLFPDENDVFVGAGTHAFALWGEHIFLGTLEGVALYTLNGQRVQTIPIAGGTSALAVSEDGRFIATAGPRGGVRVFALEHDAPPRLLRTFDLTPPRQDRVTPLAFDREARRIAAVSGSHFTCWERERNAPPRTATLVGLSGDPDRIHVTAENDWIVSTNSGELCRVSSAAEARWTWRRDTNAIPGFALEPQHDALLGIDGYSASLFRIDLDGRKTQLAWPLGRKGWVVAIARMGDCLVAATDKTLQIVSAPLVIA